MKLSQTIKELRAEQAQYQKRVEVVGTAVAALVALQQGKVPPMSPITRRALVAAPESKKRVERHFRYRFRGICANPDCTKGPGGKPKPFRGKQSRKRFCSQACGVHTSYIRTYKGADVPRFNEVKHKRMAKKPRTAAATRGTQVKRFDLFCQVCGVHFLAAKPWARVCDEHKKSQEARKLPSVPKEMRYKMTASRPPLKADKPVKLLAGDPLTAGVSGR